MVFLARFGPHLKRTLNLWFFLPSSNNGKNVCEDTKGVIGSRKSKAKQYNGHKKATKGFAKHHTEHQSLHITNPIKIPAPLVTPVLFRLLQINTQEMHNFGKDGIVIAELVDPW